MTEAFVMANKNRLAVFVEVLSGEKDVSRIAKKHRIIPRVAERAAEELVESGVVARTDGALSLTPEGERIAADMKRQELLK